MQIHEITLSRQLDEGLLDTVKAALAGGKEQYKEKQTNQAIQTITDKVYPIWTAYAKRLEQSITDPVAKQAFNNRTDGLYQKALTAFVQQNLLKNVRLNGAINSDQIIGVIKKLSEPKNDVSLPTPSTSATSPTQVKSTMINPATNKPFGVVTEALDAATEKKLFTQLVQVASLAQPDPDQQQQISQGQLINSDPFIVKFDGRTYGLNDDGQWFDIKNSRLPAQSVSAYLDQIAGVNR
jgi:hypothetical protein